MPSLNLKFLFTCFAVLIVIVFLFGVFKSPNAESVSTSNPTGSVVASSNQIPVKISYSNLEEELAKNYLIRALPENSIILLRFYNFNTGTRQWEKSYILKRGFVSEGLVENPDITLSLSSKYLEGLTNQNFCSVIQSANNNHDLGFETSLSTVSLLWKFKSVMQYKSCFGL